MVTHCTLTISSRLDYVLPLDTDTNGRESEGDPKHAQVMTSPNKTCGDGQAAKQ